MVGADVSPAGTALSFAEGSAVGTAVVSSVADCRRLLVVLDFVHRSSPGLLGPDRCHELVSLGEVWGGVCYLQWGPHQSVACKGGQFAFEELAHQELLVAA